MTEDQAFAEFIRSRISNLQREAWEAGVRFGRFNAFPSPGKQVLLTDEQINAAFAAHSAPAPKTRVTDEMVSRFLSWTLPDDFAPDCGVSFSPVSLYSWPIGTNLLTAIQARAMLEHVLAAPAAPASEPDMPDNECVICPACAHQFRAIPVQVQNLMLAAGFEPPFVAAPAPTAQAAGIDPMSVNVIQAGVPYVSGTYWKPEQLQGVTAEWPASEQQWQIKVAGPAGYVRFEDFTGDTLEDVLESIKQQGYATAPDEDGFVTMKVKV